MNSVTQILDSVRKGDPVDAATLLPLVYGELRRLAAHKLAREAAGQTIQPTALVHEAWIKLAGEHGASFEGRNHFFAAAAEAMRRILIDNARRKKARKHGGGLERVDMDEIEIACKIRNDELLAVHDSLDRLAAESASLAELVKLRFFVGMTNRECAEVLGVSEPTVERRWAFARAWLYQDIQAGEKKDGSSGFSPEAPKRETGYG